MIIPDFPPGTATEFFYMEDGKRSDAALHADAMAGPISEGARWISAQHLVLLGVDPVEAIAIMDLPLSD